jgi:Mg-chelatase subunit ChlD
MTFLLPAGLLALALAVPVVILHMLTPRRPPTEVSSLLHWDGMRHAITAAEPWQKLRWSLLLVLQLLAVVLFAVALARPATLEEAELADHTVFIIDASSSMASIDGSPDRLADAVDAAVEMRGDLPDNGIASLVIASAQPSIVVEQSGDRTEFDRAAAAIRTTGSGVDYEATFALAESLVLPDRPTGFVLVSDGQLDDVEQRLAPLGTRYVPVGASDTNRAITDLSVTAGPGGLQARVTIESTGGPSANQVLRLDVDGVTVLTEEIEVRRGEVVERTFELPVGTRVAAYLDGQDLLAADNQRYVSAPELGTLKARVHGDNTFFVNQLLSAIPEIDTDVALGEEVDFEVYVGVAVPADPVIPFIAIDAPGGAPGIVPVGRVDNPVPTLVASDPILDDIDVSGIAIAEAQRLEVAEGEILLGAPGAPLLVAGESGGLPFYYLAFTLEQSNLPVSVAYPILGARMVGGLATAGGTTEPLAVGAPVPVGPDDAAVIDPRGARALVTVGSSGPTTDLAGFWIVEGADGSLTDFAVNPDTSESRVAPAPELPEIRPAPVTDAEEAGVATVARTILPWVVAALLVVLAVELYFSFRARGVSKRQWRWGMATRAVLVGLLVLTLVDPVISTRSDEVTTVFVVDVSASMGEADRAARAWVEAALAESGGSDWAVVEFGADAHVGTPVGSVGYRPARGVDREATSIARGLRLGESVLTGETRERIVLVSDGRSNAGDLQAELDRLEALGAVVEVHTLAGEERADVAVAGIDVPNTVNEGETFDATVEVLSTITGVAEVELTDSGEVVATRTVDVVPGANQVPFEVVAAEPGLQELEAEVRMTGDTVPENDSTGAAVQVKGPASVLVVEGDEDNGSVLAEVLESAGLLVERVPVEDMPGLHQLSVHQALVLVDVSARDLGDDDVAALGTAVRDLGRGLVVVGGTHSYALGGYLDTELEALLPIDSEAPDAQREVEVAEVLLIDSSESMGACHCDEQGMGTEEGGVNKTDIAKAGALRAIDALAASDEVGLLAFSGTSEWLIPLQEFPDRATIEQGIGSIRPFGETRIIPALQNAADALRASDKEVKHIILFTDGFTSELELGADFVGQPFAGDLVAEVEELAEEGITVSVVGTGEGAIPALEEVAIAGRGRFYPGRDLDEIPEIFVKEARLASRSFINEGEFYPAVTSTAAAVRDLASSPALLGYVAASPKPTADVQLQVGEFADPLLATWRVGLGEVTAWTSDGGDRWASAWAGWEGYADFWSKVVRDTFPLAGAEGQALEARISDEQMTIRLESAEAWPAGTSPSARISFPDGTTAQVRLERASDFEFTATVPARQGGTYAVGVGFDRGDGEAATLSAVASRSFAAEYLPGPADPGLMESISTSTGGRGEIEPEQAFDPEGLEPGVSDQSLRWWFLLAAALLWPIDVALRRLRFARRERTRPRQPSPGRQPTPTTPSA